MSSGALKKRLDALYAAFDAANLDGPPDYGDPRLRIDEFNIMIDEALGRGYAPDKRRELMAVERDFRGQQEALIQSLDLGHLGPPDYLAQMNALLVDTAHRYAAILGEADYQRLFGGRPEDAANLIDPTIFLGGTPQRSN
jgi:hypothetical protein